MSSKLGLIFPELSYKVVGACMKVHNSLGASLLEKYYQCALAKEFRNSEIQFTREVPVELTYGEESIGRYFIDFVVEDKIILELKAQKERRSSFNKQVLAYLRQLNLPLGIVVNFRTDSLKPTRVVNSEWLGFKDSNKLDNN